MADDGGDKKAGGSTPAVFVSYASQDVAVANAVVEALEQHYIGCWIAPRDVTPGASYAGEIIHAIDAAKASVLILSHDAASSPHVLREVERSASKRHPIVSLRIDQSVLPADFEYFLNTSHWLDASTGDIQRALPKLIAAVQLTLNTPEVTSADSPALRPAPAASNRSPRRVALVAVSAAGLGLLGLAADRLWFYSRHSAATPAPPAAGSAPASVAAQESVPEKSVAVLPFLDLSERRDQEYFADGLAEELLDRLARIPGLRVPARTSSFYFKGKSIPVSQIARDLRVAYVVEGSVRKDRQGVRITAQLIRADTGNHVWSVTYAHPTQDVLKTEQAIAIAIADALKVTVDNRVTMEDVRPHPPRHLICTSRLWTRHTRTTALVISGEGWRRPSVL